MKRFWPPSIALVSLALLIVLATGTVLANNPDYLQYQAPKAKQTTSSVLSTISYVFFLIVTFAVVIALAYFSSRLLGQKFAGASSGRLMAVREVIPLGHNRSLYVVEFAGKALILGVTEHSINLLLESSDEQVLAQLRAVAATSVTPDFAGMLQDQMHALERLSRRLTGIRGRFHSAGDQGQEKGREQ